MYKFSIASLAFLFMFPAAVLAHEGEHGAGAPDLHPLFVIIEFAIVLWLGFMIAGWLSRIGGNKSS